MPDSNLEKQIFKTYLRMIENSEGTRMFNSLYVKEKDSGKEYDILEDGVWSGAFYVSSILSIVKLLDKPHATVSTIESVFNDKKETDRGWERVDLDNLKTGNVVIYEEVEFEDGTKSDQIGFYFNDNVAYSTSYKEKCVIKHHPTFNGERKIVRAYKNSKI